ncbi:nuclear transport factor 2 family protein [Tamlana haliotis]|uniref:Nuclear transport factor 2 family protein n=1 Tax=Pseudotamlana haliotis TaxID=2614804 RepID=A0A6N6MFV5_9FLAO|nr:SnoaL-like domain-containing protein [Tamlana haliotis]KAB1068688.1 nuclear transport factor 2 family protein [Tamlana haliotis]
MNKLIENISDINDLILQGKILEAFDLYYDDNVVIQENNKEGCLGKSENRKQIKRFVEAITEFRSAKPLHVTIGERITMVEWQFDLLHKTRGALNIKKVIVQEWRNNKIIGERQYFGA